uniref:Uncharacterized protein n=1 Tax=Pipistrellus kuhlii TaxID=59472 RepID=A0A7J7YLZ0_PIPKU|nr:hypothetical protein mPipKuh1_010057 [Pipistrellus kuhlii]
MQMCFYGKYSKIKLDQLNREQNSRVNIFLAMDGQYSKGCSSLVSFKLFFFTPSHSKKYILCHDPNIYIHTHSLPKLHVIPSDTCYSILLCFILFKECCSQSTKLISSPLKGCNPELEKCCSQPEQCPQVPALALLSLNGTFQAGYLLAWHPLFVIIKLLSVHVNNVGPKWLA